MSESWGAAVLGTTASVLFVLSHVPQIVALRHGAHVPSALMFGMQLVSGGLWIVYGWLEQAYTILVFGSLSTVFRLVILGCLAPDRRRALVLMGGGRLPAASWHVFARRVPRWTRVHVVAHAEDGAAAARTAVWALRGQGCWATHCTDLATLRGPVGAIWFTGGDTSTLVGALAGAKVRREDLQRCPLVGGTSAGAHALARMGLLSFSLSTHGRTRGDVALDEGAVMVLEDDAIAEVHGRVRVAGVKRE